MVMSNKDRRPLVDSTSWAIERYFYLFVVSNDMNAFDKQNRACTAWCEDCDKVFDFKPVAEMHASEQKHRVKITEFWVTRR